MTRHGETTVNKVSDAELAAFVLAAQEKAGWELGYEVGRQYARIFIPNYSNEGDRTVFCFVDLTNGNVLRPDGWKRPNLKVRNSIQGNVFDEHKGSGSIGRGPLSLVKRSAS